MEKIKKGLSLSKYKKFLYGKINSEYKFFDLEFIKFAYLLPCKDASKTLGLTDKDLSKITDGVFSTKSKIRRKKFNEVLRLFLANIVAKDGELIISLSMDDYVKDGMYHNIVPLVTLRKVIYRLEDMGYIEIKKGEFRHHNTTIYAKKSLWMDMCKLENLRLQVRKLSHVTGYAEDRGEKLHKIISTVEKQENELAKHEVTIHYKDHKTREKYCNRFEENVSLGETMFRRNFLGAGKGGRFYARGKGSIYQRMPSEVRDCLRIDGEETVELDFKCEHLNLLYAKEGIDMWNKMNDAYSINGIDNNYRFVVKVALLIMLNCQQSSNLFNVVYAHFNKDKEKWRRNMFFEKFIKEFNQGNFNEFIDKIKEKHSSISKYFCSKIGNKLQRQDSDIMAEILEKCLDNDIIALPVHDSVIVKKKDLEKVIEIMNEAFFNETGFKAKIEFEV